LNYFHTKPFTWYIIVNIKPLKPTILKIDAYILIERS